MINKNNISGTDKEQLEKYRALSNPLRLKLWSQFQKKRRTVSEAAEELGIDRILLYYHARILLKAGLIKKVENRKAGHVTESVYGTKDITLYYEPGSDAVTRNVISIMQETVDDFHKSKSYAEKVSTGAGRHILKIKSENFNKKQKIIDALAIEVLDRLDDIEDKDGDRSYSFTLMHFEL